MELFSPPNPGRGDYHAHIFQANQCFTPSPRYVPTYDATLDGYFAVLEEHRLSWGTLVQPSFLGTNNSLITSALREHPDRLRGVAAVDWRTPQQTIKTVSGWDGIGFRGVRINTLGQGLPDLESAEWVGFINEIAGADWHLEFHIEEELLRLVARKLAKLPCKVVIDHYGLPTSQEVSGHPLLDLAQYEHVWVKASGVYRCREGAAESMKTALSEQGFCRFIPGSDWPHTNFESDPRGAWDGFGDSCQLEPGR